MLSDISNPENGKKYNEQFCLMRNLMFNTNKKNTQIYKIASNAYQCHLSVVFSK